MSAPADKEFVNTLSSVLDLISLLKYNVETFRGLDVHKDVLPNKNMKPDCVLLIQALNAFIFKMKDKCDPVVFGKLLRVMERDELHEISLHLEVASQFKDLTKITEAMRQSIKEQIGRT